jgi:hypothetical protein
VGTAQIADLAVSSVKIADAAITSAKIANLAVTNAKIDSLDASKITTGYLSASRIAAGTIIADHLIANCITTPKIADNAITIPASAFTSGSFTLTGDFQAVQSISITSTGAPIHINATMRAHNGTPNPATVHVRILRDTLPIHADEYTLGSIRTISIAIARLDQPGVGVFTYSLLAMGTSIVIWNPSIVLLEVKK